MPNITPRYTAWHSGRGKKTRQTEEEDGPVQQVPEVENRGKMKKTACEIICGAQTTLAVNRWIMMMTLFGSRSICLPKAAALRQETRAIYENQFISSHRVPEAFETVLGTELRRTVTDTGS